MRTMSWLRLVLVGFVVASAGAAEIWTDIGSRVAKFDSTNPGVITYVGTGTGQLEMDGMDFAADGTLYGEVDGRLYSVDQTNGTLQYIGTAQLPQGNILMDLSWNPVAQQMYAIDGSYPPILYQVNLGNGALTAVGPLGVSPLALSGGLATSAAGVRYVDDSSMNGLWRLNGLNGIFLGPEGFDVGGLFGGMTIDWSRDGTLYHGVFNAATERTELWAVNVATGVGTFRGAIDGPSAITLSVAIKPIPEPAGLLILAMLMVCARSRRAV